MAHEISINEQGQAEAAFANEKPWHGLGALVDDLMTTDEALDRAHLRWTVEKEPLYLGNGERVADKVALIRSDSGAYLGTVGPDWVPVQNEEQGEFIAALTGEGAAVVECVGALKGGRRTFWTIKVPGELVIGDADRIDKYLIVANGHDGSLAFRAFWSPIRVVCQNTLNASLRDARDGVVLRHTSKVTTHLDEARRVLSLADAYYNAAAREFQRMMRRSMNEGEFRLYVDEVFPIAADRTMPTTRQKKVREQVAANWHEGTGAEMAGRTAWGAYNAVTEYLDHQRSYRGKTAGEKKEQRFETVLLGYGKDIQQRAFDTALALCK